MRIITAILVGCMLIGTCAACAPVQPEQKEKTFFEQRYTTLSYDEYFSEMRLAKDLPYIPSDEIYPAVGSVSYRGEPGDETLYIIPVNSEGKIAEHYAPKTYAAPADTVEPIKVLEHIKEKTSESPRETVCVTADDKIYSVDCYTGSAFLLYESPTPVSNIDATDDLIVYNTGNTVYRLFRPTGRVDEISLPVEEGQTLSGGAFILCNMLLRYTTEGNPEYAECVALNPGGEDAEVTCWDELAAKYGDDVWQTKKDVETFYGAHPTMKDVLVQLRIAPEITHTYDLQTGEVYKYGYSPCPCPYSDICWEFTR